MSPSRPRTNRLRGIIVGVVALSALLMLAGQSIAIGAGQGELAAVRQATDKFHDLRSPVMPATARSTSAPTTTAAPARWASTTSRAISSATARSTR